MDARNGIGETPLYNAVELGNTSVVMALTKLGADVNVSLADYDSYDTLLDIAIEREARDSRGIADISRCGCP